MRLITLHGRKDPAENMPDWGFDGPTIEGVVAVHSTYGTYNVFFTDAAAAQAAHLLTGWKFFDDHALEMAFHDDLLVMKPETAGAAYYGDFELQDAAPGQTAEMLAALKSARLFVEAFLEDDDQEVGELWHQISAAIAKATGAAS